MKVLVIALSMNPQRLLSFCEESHPRETMDRVRSHLQALSPMSDEVLVLRTENRSIRRKTLGIR